MSRPALSSAVKSAELRHVLRLEALNLASAGRVVEAAAMGLIAGNLTGAEAVSLWDALETARNAYVEPE